jgi:hypothetical protein
MTMVGSAWLTIKFIGAIAFMVHGKNISGGLSMLIDEINSTC